MIRARRLATLVALISLASLSSGGSLARADDRFRPFTWPEKGITLGLVGASVATGFLVHAPEERARLDGEILLDGVITRSLGVETFQGAARAGNWSDWARNALFLAPLIAPGDSGGTGRWQVAESYALTGIVNTSIKAAAGRARPFTAQCRDNSMGQDCFSSYRNESFPSGHAAIAFTSAGLLCALRDDALCPIGLGVASATGILRIVARQHYLSDVVFGAALGWVSGYYVPKWRGRLHPGNSRALGYQFAISF